MRPIREWKKVLKRAWSVRLSVLAALLGACEFALPYLDGYVDIPPKTFAALAMVTSLAAGIARIVAQVSITGDSDGTAATEEKEQQARSSGAGERAGAGGPDGDIPDRALGKHKERRVLG